MRLTKDRLKQIIKEEVAALQEARLSRGHKGLLNLLKGYTNNRALKNWKPVLDGAEEATNEDVEDMANGLMMGTKNWWREALKYRGVKDPNVNCEEHPEPDRCPLYKKVFALTQNTPPSNNLKLVARYIANWSPKEEQMTDLSKIPGMRKVR